MSAVIFVAGGDAPLATATDLADRNITVPDGMDGAALLAAASDAVRAAAGAHISQATSTVTIGAWSNWIDLPDAPIQSVESVKIAGEEVSGWYKVDASIRIPAGISWMPVEVTITYTHGYPTVPADIVDLVCGMVGMAISDPGYGSARNVQKVQVDEASETYFRSATPSPMTIPAALAASLRTRFSTGVYVVGSRR